MVKNLVKLQILVVFCLSLVVISPLLTLGAGYGTHAVAGGAIGRLVAQTDLQAFLLGFVSHALFDMMPHCDPRPSQVGQIAFHTVFNLGGLYTTYDMYNRNGQDSRIFWGALGGILPDAEHVLYFEKCWEGNCPQKIYPSHNGLLPHRGGASFLRGYANEVALIGISITVTF